jgi:hypothetical protein
MRLWLTVLAALALLGFFGWYEYEHPCVRSETLWVPPFVDLQHEPDGNVSPVHHPGHWARVCLERTTRLP